MAGLTDLMMLGKATDSFDGQRLDVFGIDQRSPDSLTAKTATRSTRNLPFLRLLVVWAKTS